MDFIWTFVVDHTPIWVWLTILGLVVGAAFYFLSPILVPLWNITPRWIKVVLAFIVSVILAALAGRYRGSQDERDKQNKANADALNKRKEVDSEVDKQTPEQTRQGLDRWYRD